MNRLMLFPAAVRREPAIDAWLQSRPDELRGIAVQWFTFIRGCGADVRELLHDGHPTACVGEAAFAYVNVFTGHVNVGFFHGAALPDPKRLLEGTGKFMRHVKLNHGQAVDDEALRRLIETAYTDIKLRLQIR